MAVRDTRRRTVLAANGSMDAQRERRFVRRRLREVEYHAASCEETIPHGKLPERKVDGHRSMTPGRIFDLSGPRIFGDGDWRSRWGDRLRRGVGKRKRRER